MEVKSLLSLGMVLRQRPPGAWQTLLKMWKKGQASQAERWETGAIAAQAGAPGAWWTGCPAALINPVVPAHGHPPADAGN